MNEGDKVVLPVRDDSKIGTVVRVRTVVTVRRPDGTDGQYEPAELRIPVEYMTDDPLDDAPPEVRARFVVMPEQSTPEEGK